MLPPSAVVRVTDQKAARLVVECWGHFDPECIEPDHHDLSVASDYSLWVSGAKRGGDILQKLGLLVSSSLIELMENFNGENEEQVDITGRPYPRGLSPGADQQPVRRVVRIVVIGSESWLGLSEQLPASG